jgi:transposase
MQTGWFKEVRVKDLDSHSARALLASRALLVKIKRDLENQIRGLLKNVAAYRRDDHRSITAARPFGRRTNLNGIGRCDACISGQ